ncbi:MAG: hypothetical protein JST11_24375 [Acidobacteria bacterium]|nr:hypothetical protein [Acidobacteriota bacterium]
MERNRKLIFAKCAVVAGAIPFLLWAHEYGPDPGYCGVPHENGTCASSQCHVGTANNPVNTGSVTVTFPVGKNYVPGVKQHLVVTIYDPVQHAWGFQLTARLTSDSATQAGTFASTDQNTLVMCSTANLTQLKEMDFGAPQTCPSNMPLAYIEHSLAGYNATKGQSSPVSYEFDWTPPATASGTIDLYVAGNAANGDLTGNGDHIYTNKYTLSPLATSGPPAISANGVVSAGAFGGFPTVAPGSWMEIYGSNLSGTTRGWTGNDFVGLKAPTVLDGVSVTIGGKQAFIDYVSPGQVNAQVPSGVPTGAQQMTVTNAGGTSSSYGITVNPLQPGLLAPGSFSIGGKQYVVAQFSDGSYVLPPNSISGLTTRQAKPGETVIIYGVGFGPVLDSGNQNIPAGTIVQAVNKLANPFTMSIGGSNATLGYAGLAPNFVGLYQFNVVVPNIANNDLAPLTFSLNGTAGTQTLYLAVKQ